MDKFVHRENIEHYKKILAVTNDPAARAMILKLLAEEQETKETAPKKE